MKKIIYASLAFFGLAFANQTVEAKSYYILANKEATTVAFAGFPSTADFNAKAEVILAANSDDKLSKVIKLPFAFTFFGKAVTHYKACDNGFITFDTTTTKTYPSNSVLPAGGSDGPQNSILASWNDWGMATKYTNGTDGSKVQSYTYGTSGDMTHIIYWALMSNKAQANTFATFMIILKEKGSKVYIYQGAGLDGISFTSLGNIVKNTVGVNLNSTDGSDFNGLTNYVNGILYSAIEGVQPKFDLKMTGLFIDKYVEAGKNATSRISFTNFGTDSLTSIKINTLVEGTVITQNVPFSPRGLAASGGSVVISLNNLLFTKSKTTQPIKVWLSEPNGSSAVIATPEDDTLNSSIYVSGGLTRRKVLIEEFTSATCPPCAAINGVFNDTLKNYMYDNLVSVIKFQGPIPAVGDPMYDFAKTDVDTRMTYYGVNSHPSARVDGLVYSGHPANVVANPSIVRGEARRGAGAKIEITPSVSGNDYNFKIKVTPNISFTPNTADNTIGEYRLFAAAVANYITYPNNNKFLSQNNTRWNGEYFFENTMREMLPSASGTALGTLTEGVVAKTVDLTYTYDNSIELKTKPNGMKLTVWVQNTVTGEVLNSYTTNDEFTIGVEDLSSDAIQASLFPNPSNGQTVLRFNLDKSASVSATIVDIQGRTVSTIQNYTVLNSGANQINFDASALTKGIYFVNVNVNGVNTSKKLIVQ